MACGSQENKQQKDENVSDSDQSSQEQYVVAALDWDGPADLVSGCHTQP